MTEKSINEQYAIIRTFLEAKRLKEALTQMESLLWQCSDWNIRTRLEQLQTSYKYMLEYMKQGIDDPERRNLHKKMITEAWEIADQMQLVMLDKESSKYYHELRRTPVAPRHARYTLPNILIELEGFQENLSILEMMSAEDMKRDLERHSDVLQYLFNSTWSNSAWNVEEEEAAQAMLHSSKILPDDLCLFVSAVTLSVMDCFDFRKICWLLDAYSHTENAVRQRALVGTLIVFHLHRNRINLYPELHSRVETLNELPHFAKELTCVYRQMLLCQETEKIEKKMRDEILPEMLKNASSMKNMRFGLEENEEEMNDLNPDWQNTFENEDLQKKLREMSELQMEGADVYMSTFSSLKSYPFFRQIPNWFYPFSPYQTDVYLSNHQRKGKVSNSVIDLVLQSGYFSNSDKYSLFLTIHQLPASQQEMMLSQLSDQQMAELAEKSHSENLQNFNKRSDTLSNQYLHDLYRFLKLNTYRRDFRDLFKEKLDFQHIPAFSHILMKADILIPFTDFYVSKERWDEAIELFKELEALADEQPNGVEFYQKYGYALQKKKAYHEAIEAYLKADTLKPDNIWNNRHLATCYRLTRQYDKALSYYRKVEESRPEDAQALFYIGHCLAEMERYEEALNCFFKLDFMESGPKAWRGIGWCSFVCQKYEQALRYYQKIIEQKPMAIDYMNSGHAAWAMGDIQQAITLYGKAITADGSRDRFIEAFRKDQEALVRQGICQDDIPLLLDLL